MNNQAENKRNYTYTILRINRNIQFKINFKRFQSLINYLEVNKAIDISNLSLV